MDPSKLTEIGVGIGIKVIGAIIFWFVGRWLIDLAIKLASRGMRIRQVEPTVISYAGSTIAVMLNIVLVVAILGYFGIETTSFAALLAAAGFAIGAAWSGLLANFAAGAFLIVLQPFKVGDFITGGGVTGTVREIGLFVTKIDTLDNVMTMVGNNKLFSDNIQNFSTNPYRRVDLVAQLNHAVNHEEAIRILRERLANIPNVLSEPAPDVEILEFNLAGPVLAVRPYCNNQHYWQVYFNTNEVIRESFGAAGFPAPEQHYFVRRSA
ncbi:mechanosensitive ion channel family protein [Pseudanabaena sp. PCC 6802]|uniref:mechanosensitive ion channel family protein n=1 Tax=Pseudanabaena sp. PCC 6802 TaxID=118173 RepID=UPI0003466E36|nr:mechanosensitive ion channel family protein [Pseudanabaena sp. PCC 6802]